MKKLYLVVILSLFLVGCGKREAVSFDTVEQARGQARENAAYNAQTYRANSPQFQAYNVQNNGDSSQTNECPQGDGWASLKLVDPKNVNVIVKIKCSTVSAGIGCMTEEEFKTKPTYSQEDGRCQPTNKVPFPLPKVAGK
jgi:hypothetical protein